MQSRKSPEKKASSKKKTIARKSVSKAHSASSSTAKAKSKKGAVRSDAAPGSPNESPLKKAGISSSSAGKTFTNIKNAEKTNETINSPAQPSTWSPAHFVPSAYAERQNRIAPRYFFNSSIPESYHQSYFRAMARDPEWAFAYWEINPDQIKKIKSSLGEELFEYSKRIIRLLDVTGISYDGSNSLSYTDIEINNFANNWYVKVPQPGKTYLMEIGFLSPQGAFEVIMRSNQIQVPKAEPGSPTAGQWGSMDTDELLHLSGVEQIRVGASENMTIQHIERKAKYSNPLSIEQIGASENVLFWGASDHVSSDWAVNR